MPKTNKKTWTSTEDEQLVLLFKNNAIDFKREEDREYLWEKTQEHFPNHLGEGASGKNNAIRRLREKCRKWDLDQSLKGARKSKGKGKS